MKTVKSYDVAMSEAVDLSLENDDIVLVIEDYVDNKYRVVFDSEYEGDDDCQATVARFFGGEVA